MVPMTMWYESMILVIGHGNSRVLNNFILTYCDLIIDIL
jgi:hypothetical protein